MCPVRNRLVSRQDAMQDLAHLQVNDIESHMTELVPKEAAYEHAEGNSDSHIKTVLVGPSCTAPVRDGKLALGTWQAIFLCEWDGPRTRRVEVAVSRV